MICRPKKLNAAMFNAEKVKLAKDLYNNNKTNIDLRKNMNTYYVYRVNFQPEPIIQGKIEKFDAKEEARQYINQKKSSYEGSKWLIVRQISSSESYELQELI